MSIFKVVAWTAYWAGSSSQTFIWNHAYICNSPYKSVLAASPFLFQHIAEDGRCGLNTRYSAGVGARCTCSSVSTSERYVRLEIVATGKHSSTFAITLAIQLTPCLSQAGWKELSQVPADVFSESG